MQNFTNVPSFLVKHELDVIVECELTNPAATIRVSESYVFDEHEEVYHSERPFTSLIDAADYYTTTAKFLSGKIKFDRNMVGVVIEWRDFNGDVHETITIKRSGHDGFDETRY